MSRAIFLDGAKAIDLWGDTGWTIISQPLTWSDKDPVHLAVRVGLLARAIEIRGQSILEIPWEVRRNNEVVWSSSEDTPPSQLRWFSNFPELLSLTEQSLVMKSQAFWHVERNRVRANRLTWFSPLTMQVLWNDDLRIDKFLRTYDASEPARPYLPEDIVYIWYRSPIKETEPRTSPLDAAARTAKVIDNLDLFVSTFFERGAIKATLLTVEGNPAQQERDRLKNWWESALTGIKKAFSTEVVSASVKPVVVGEGLREMSNTDLSREKREDLVSIMGVPLSKIFSNAANFATADQDDKAFYKNTIIPDCRLIQHTVNTAIEFTGYQLVFTPETMDVFQEEETSRAQAYGYYVGNGMKPSIAAAILGIELPEGVEYADLDPIPPKFEPVQPTTTTTESEITEPAMEVMESEQEEQTQKSIDVVITAEQLEDLNKYRRKVFKRLAAGKELVCDFQSDSIPASVLNYMRYKLYDAETHEDVEEILSEKKLKALILRLDPDDEEAERDSRMDIEKRSVKAITTAFGNFSEEIFSSGEPTDPETDAKRIIDEFVNDRRIRDAMDRMLLESALLGVDVAAKQLDVIGLGIDWLVPNNDARLWAANYTDVLLQQLGSTTQAVVGSAIARWIDNNEPLSVLVADLEPVFGKERAKLIASTEVTRAFTEGNLAAWRVAGYGYEDPQERSPKHPRCRCILVLRINDDGSADYLWYTAVDERTCPQCGALHNTVVGKARLANAI